NPARGLDPLSRVARKAADGAFLPAPCARPPSARNEPLDSSLALRFVLLLFALLALLLLGLVPCDGLFPLAASFLGLNFQGLVPPGTGMPDDRGGYCGAEGSLRGRPQLVTVAGVEQHRAGDHAGFGAGERCHASGDQILDHAGAA